MRLDAARLGLAGQVRWVGSRWDKLGFGTARFVLVWQVRHVWIGSVSVRQVTVVQGLAGKVRWC